MTVAVVLAPLPVCGQEVESVGGGYHRGRSFPVCGRGLLTATALDACALVLGETGLDAGLAGTGRGLLTATDHVGSVRVPQLAGEIMVTARDYAISRVDLVTARGHAIDYLPPLTFRGQGRKDGEPDEISRRVWRRWKSPRLLLYLKRRLELLPLREGLL